MAPRGYVAIDLGAESGRAMLATLDGGKVRLEEVHRFLNIMQRLPSGYHWNLLDLWGHIVEGLRRAVELGRQRGLTIASVGVDTWGVDYGLLGKSGQLLGLPFAYRDERNPPAMEQALRKVTPQAMYEATGIQFMPFNTVFQLVAHQRAEPEILGLCEQMLNIPDLLHYFLSGRTVHEATIASTTAMVDPRSGHWAQDLLKKLDLPVGMLGSIVPAGTRIGELRPEVAQAVGLPAGATIDVIVPGSHDTASAVAAVPVDSAAGRWVYLSSGTWSLMGAELDEPVVNEAARLAGFTNERGVGGKIRFLKNISGLWLVQEVRRDYARVGENFEYAELAAQAARVEAFRTLVDPDHAAFASPGNIRDKIDAFAKATGQPAPSTPGAYVCCCLESLALKYRLVLDRLEKLMGWKAELLHIVGGGGQNELLNQMTADALDRTVIVGPVEATAVGNALTQAIGAGDLDDLAHLRKVIRDSFTPARYTPQNADAFAAQMQRFVALEGK